MSSMACMPRLLTRLPVLLAGLLACAEPPVESSSTPTPDLPVTPVGVRGDHHVIYIPAYSYVDVGDRGARRFSLTTTLSVHNVSFRDSIWIDKVRYYDTEGRLVYDFLERKIALRPMQTHKVRIASSDTTGGSGANFLVEWEGPPGVPAPLAEAVHVGVSSTVGLSFVTRGTPLTPHIVPDRFPQP